MSDRAVFFDPTHRRWWWVKRLGTLLGLAVVVTVSVWLVSLFTSPLLNPFPGITEAIKRGLRVPQHRAARTQFLLKHDRERLLVTGLRIERDRAAVRRPGLAMGRAPLMQDFNVMVAPSERSYGFSRLPYGSLASISTKA